jgi:hypothetical protein
VRATTTNISEPLAPNAGRQARLEAVACTPWFGWEGLGHGYSLSFEPTPSLIPPHGIPPQSVPLPSSLLDHLVCLMQECWRKRQAKGLSRLQIHAQVKLVPQLHRQVRRLGALQNLVYKDSGALA